MDKNLKKVAFHTLGCKVNQVESEDIKEEFIQKGYQLVNFDMSADIYIINTCTVTHISDRKSRAMIRRAVRNNPKALVVALGCLPQVDAEQLNKIDGLDLILGNEAKPILIDIIENHIKDSSNKIKILNELKVAMPKEILYSSPHERTRAFIKIQDGCESYCSYCIVPYARGSFKSKDADFIIHKFGNMLKLGYKEIVLTGIHTGFYGIDLEFWNLDSLLRELLDRYPGDYRIRLSSIEALEVSQEIIKIMKEEKRLCRHLHIPLQSGSDNILEKMNRRYNRDFYINLLNGIKDKMPDIAITTDIMVGFPGEEEIDFEESYQLIKNSPISDLHIFKYSRREGTPAASFSMQIDEKVKQRRSEVLRNLAEQKKLDFQRSFIGKPLRVVIEKEESINLYKGLSDNYFELMVQGEGLKLGEMYNIQPMEEKDGQFRAKI